MLMPRGWENGAGHIISGAHFQHLYFNTALGLVARMALCHGQSHINVDFTNAIYLQFRSRDAVQ